MRDAAPPSRVQDHRPLAGPVPKVDIYLPAEALRSYVTFYYFVECDGPFNDFLYPEWGNVRIGVTGDWSIRMDDCYPVGPQLAALYGPTDRPGQIITSGGKTVGFGMTPLGWDRFIRSGADSMANRVASLGEILGIDPSDLRQSLVDDADNETGVARFDRLLIALLERCPANDALALATDRALRSSPADVPAFAAAAGISTRTLQRICLRTFGFAPKRLLRRQRFMNVLGQIRVKPDGTLDNYVGDEYFDHSHFLRDFATFMGMTSRTYLRAPRVLTQQAAVAQARLGIDLSFRLPLPAVR